MASIQILLITLFLVFFILTRKVWIIIEKQERLDFEVHFPILAIHFRTSNDEGGKKKRRNQQKLSIPAYLRIISAVIKKMPSSCIKINRVVIPISSRNLSSGSFTKPLIQQYTIFFLIAYLKAKTRKILVVDNAFTLSPDITIFQFHLTVKPRIYELIQAILTYKIRSIKETKHARMEKNVRE